MQKVIVLMSTFNGQLYVSTQIDSILNQKGVDVELVIRDDGSTDDTISILRNKVDSRITILSGENCGCSASFFKLLEYAQYNFDNSDLFAFADQDDYWLDDKLSCAVKFFDNMDLSLPSLYISNLYVVDGELKNAKLLYSVPIDLSKEHSLVQNHATGCTMVFNKEAINKVLTKDTSVFRIHDIPLFLQCLFLGNVVYDEKSHILYRQHQNNVIGAGVLPSQRLKSKYQSLKCFWKQHQKESDARVFYSQYKDDLTPEDAEYFCVLMNYRKKISYRFKMLFSNRYRRLGRIDNFFFKLRVVFGNV